MILNLYLGRYLAIVSQEDGVALGPSLVVVCQNSAGYNWNVLQLIVRDVLQKKTTKAKCQILQICEEEREKGIFSLKRH